jgi:hypothetical protein
MVLEAADPAYASATPDERAWIRVIQAETHAHAGDNIDRTHAYQKFWLANPEIHWALLASLVSRNTGYMMTDLGGEPLGRLLDRTVARRLFLSLERCNWLIFQDAYPQLLLYSLSKMLGRPMFHLLPALGHSTGMVAFWDAFWRDRQVERLALALIVNEQNYIHERVVWNAQFGPPFRRLAMTFAQRLYWVTVVFPEIAPDRPSEPRLLGRTVRRFTSLDRRIETGRELYQLLFPDGTVRPGIRAWLGLQPIHTGSRTDYWSHVYGAQASRGDAGELFAGPHRADGFRFFSPGLRSIWPRVVQQSPDGGDWRRDAGMDHYLRPLRAAVAADLSQRVLAGLHAMHTLGKWTPAERRSRTSPSPLAIIGWAGR